MSHISFSLLGLLIATAPAAAQSTISPAVDWNGNYGFSSPADRNLRLLRADLIEKKEEGYYESLGETNVNAYNDVTNNVTNDNRIGQNTNAIGAVNNSETNIDIEGIGNAVSAENGAQSTGCQDASIDTGGNTGAPGAATCN